MAKKIARPKPKFNVKQFLDGMAAWQERTAKDFLLFVQHKHDNQHYDFTVIEQLVHTKEKIDPVDVKNSIQANKKAVFVKSGKVVQELSYKELWTILEYGRKDKGIMPNPLLRKAFEDYRPIFRNRLKSFLLGKK